MENTCSPKQIEPQVSKETNPNNSTGEINQECDIGNKDSKSVYKDKSRFSADIKPGFRKNIEDKHLKSNPNAINKRFRSVGDLRFSGEKHKAEEKTNKIAAEPSSALIKDKRCESLSSLHVNEKHETTKTESERKGRVWYYNRNRYRRRSRGKAMPNHSNDEKGNARSDKGSSSNNKAIDSTEFHALDKQTIVSRGKLQGLENAFEKLSCKRKGDKPAINSIQITDKPPSGKKSSTVHRGVDRGKGCVTASIDVNIDSDTSKRNDAMKYNPKQCNIFRADLKESVKVDVKVEKKNNERRPNTNNRKAGKCDTISSDQRKKNMPARPCDLYVVLTDPISERSQIKEYLNHRMGNPRSLVFGVGTLSKQSQSCDDNGSLNTVVMKLPSYSKACDARHLLNKSNRNTESKVHCFFTEDEAKGAKKKTDIDKSQLMQSAIQDLVGRAHEVLDKHDTKIREVQGFLEATENKLSRKRGLPFNEFEMLTNTKLAQDDKLEELSGQRKEFCNYIQAMKTKINEIQNNRKFENDLREIRKMFGVECQKLITALPMYARREDILTTVKHNQVSIVLGETGSGKSTQMVQYLYQAGFADEGLIVCTQPRKIAAVSLATHVASELTSSVGQVVGYKVGMQSKKTALTKVMFMTDHVLLNECLRDANLSAYSCIIIDEAHERSIHTDLLLGMLKKCTTKRPELRVVITSATIDPDVFVTYFGGSQKCPVLSVSGRTFPVEVLWESVDWSRDTAFPDNYEAKALDKAIEVHTSNAVADGDILVFLTSAVETERCCEKFQKKIQGNDYHCLQLHGKLKPDEQQLVFAKNPRGKRKIVFATNSAETSITIPGIKFVIDTGVAKEMRYDPKKNMNSLVVCPISQSSANQRKGRAGRTASGICYRLYTDRDFQSMHKCSTPEILRIHLGQGILKLMELGVNPMTFDFVKPPSSGAMEAALETLVEIGAVEGTDITGLGKWIAKLPVEPRLGAMIKKGIDDGVATEAIVIAASCSQNGIFFRVGSAEQKKKADLKKVRFCHVGGDLLTLLSAFREWDKVNEKGKGKWCVDNSINGKSMKVIRDVMNETLSILRKEAQLKLKHEFRNPDEADSIVQKLIFNCMKSNVCFYLGHEKAGYVTADRLQHVKVHPSSSLLSLGQQPTWVIYSQLLKTSDDFITNITPVPEEYIDDAIEKELLKIDKEKLERRQVKLVMKIPVGKHVFWKLIGPMHTNRREVEDNIRSVCSGTVVVVEADKFRGEITLYCVPKYKGDATAMLEGVVTSLPEQLLIESREEPIGHDFSGVRALLREGGAVSTILMPDQYRSLNIKQKDFRRYELTEDGVHLQFSFYGQIEQVWKSCGKRQQNQIYWGRVTFVNESDALSAVEEINDDENCDFTVVPITYRSSVAKPEEFTMKLKWCRRPAKGICYVYLSCPEDMARLLMASPIEIDGGLVHISRSREQSDLYIRGFDPDITEDLVKEGLLEALNLSPQNHGNRFKIIIPRKIVPIQHDEMNQIHEKFTRILSRFAQPATFRTDIRDYKQQTAFCTAFVKFGNPKICSDVAKGLIVTEADINGNLIDVTTEFKTTVFLNRRVYESTKKDIDDFIEMRRQNNISKVTDP